MFWRDNLALRLTLGFFPQIFFNKKPITPKIVKFLNLPEILKSETRDFLFCLICSSLFQISTQIITEKYSFDPFNSNNFRLSKLQLKPLTQKFFFFS